MASTLEIINGISQAMSKAYDGATDSEGEPIKIGLKREQGSPLTDSRVMDGFTVKVLDNKLCIYYNSEINIKDAHGKDFESDLEQNIQDVSSFLKKEYRKVTGSSLSLKKIGEIEVLVQNISRIRSLVQARCHYEIGGLDSAVEEKKLDSSIEKWLSLGGGKKAKNDKRKEDNFDHFDPTNLKAGIRK